MTVSGGWRLRSAPPPSPRGGVWRKRGAGFTGEIEKPFEVVELDLDEPKTGEVLIRFAASGLCHSDYHLRIGDIPVRYPLVGGHEGSGVVEKVGAGVTRLSPGYHAITSFLP